MSKILQKSDLFKMPLSGDICWHTEAVEQCWNAGLGENVTEASLSEVYDAFLKYVYQEKPSVAWARDMMWFLYRVELHKIAYYTEEPRLTLGWSIVCEKFEWDKDIEPVIEDTKHAVKEVDKRWEAQNAL